MPVPQRSGDVKTLGAAWRAFLAAGSPYVLGGAVVAFLALRIALGDWTWRDAAVAGGLLAVYPFGEWAIHVYLLHLEPFRWRGRMVEIEPSRAHRSHHEHPNRLDWVLLGPREITPLLGLAVPLVAALLCLLTGALDLRPVLSGMVAGSLLVFAYEWTHFLIHTAYRPRRGPYRLLWRTHRLHHFKNEHYWHGITSTIADRAFGTYPDQRGVPRSPTARTLER